MQFLDDTFSLIIASWHKMRITSLSVASVIFIFHLNHKNYNFLNCDLFEKLLFSTYWTICYWTFCYQKVQ